VEAGAGVTAGRMAMDVGTRASRTEPGSDDHAGLQGTQGRVRGEWLVAHDVGPWPPSGGRHPLLPRAAGIRPYSAFTWIGFERIQIIPSRYASTR
jgi:hypothetical protein